MLRAVSPEQRAALDEDGFVILRDFMPPELLTDLRAATLRRFEIEGEAAGAEYKQEPQARRLANLADKGEVFRRILEIEELRPYLEHVLGPDYKLSSLNARSANPHSDSTQPLHCDMAAIPDERGYWVCNTVWMLDDFTPENGPLRAVPGSHRWGKLPQEALEDPAAPHPHEALVTAPAGSVVVMNAHLWHGGLANRTGRPRLAVHAFFCRRDKPQQFHQKPHLSPETLAALSPRLRWLLAIDDPLNDELSAAVKVQSGFMR